MSRIIIAIAVILSSATAAWALEVVSQPEKGVELTLAALTLPNGATGAIRYRTCEDCPLEQHRITARTKYLVDRQEVAFADFVLAADGIRQQGDSAQTTFVGVYIDIESQNVNRIALSRRKL
jgi:hypothetical protein